MKLFSMIIAAVLAASTTFADSVVVTKEGSSTFNFIKVEAKNVKGVEVVLKKEVLREDCNKITLNADAVRVSGNQMNWNTTFFITTSLMATEVYCPLQKAIKETVRSLPIVLKSYTNPNIQAEVLVTLVVPEGFEVEAKEIK